MAVIQTIEKDQLDDSVKPFFSSPEEPIDEKDLEALQKKDFGEAEGHPFRGNQWTEAGEYKGPIPKGGFKATVPEFLSPHYDMDKWTTEQLKKAKGKSVTVQGLFDFKSQTEQYPKKGPAGIGYFKGDVGGGKHVDALLYRDKKGKVVGVLNHYPFDFFPHEKKGNFTVMVHPDNRKQGIASALVREAGKRWDLRLVGQNFTPSGAALVNALVGKKKFVDETKTVTVDYAQIEGKLNALEQRALKNLHRCMEEIRDKTLSRVRRTKDLRPLIKEFKLPNKGILRDAVMQMLTRAWDAGNTDVARERRMLKRAYTYAEGDGPNGEQGVWRTIRGVHIFIRIGQTIADAIKNWWHDEADGGKTNEQASEIEEEARAISEQFPTWSWKAIAEQIKKNPNFDPHLVDDMVTAMHALREAEVRVYLTPQDVHIEGPLAVAKRKPRLCSKCGEPAIVKLGDTLLCSGCSAKADARNFEELHFDQEVDAIMRVAYELAIQFPNYGKDSILSIMLNKKEFDPELVRQVIDHLWQSGRLRANYEEVHDYAGSSPASAGLSSAMSWLRGKAFYITDLISNRLTEAARGILLNGMKSGKSVNDIVNDLGDKFMPYVGDKNVIADDKLFTPYRLETIVRTNTTDAYNHGRLTDMTDPDVLPFIKAVKYSAILDSRTTEVCQFLDGFLFKPGDADLEDLIPPLHFNCRSILVPIVVGMDVDDADFITDSDIGKAKALADARFMEAHGLWKNYVERDAGDDAVELEDDTDVKDMPLPPAATQQITEALAHSHEALEQSRAAEQKVDEAVSRALAQQAAQHKAQLETVNQQLESVSKELKSVKKALARPFNIVLEREGRPTTEMEIEKLPNGRFRVLKKS